MKNETSVATDVAVEPTAVIITNDFAPIQPLDSYAFLARFQNEGMVVGILDWCGGYCKAQVLRSVEASEETHFCYFSPHVFADGIRNGYLELVDAKEHFESFLSAYENERHGDEQ